MFDFIGDLFEAGADLLGDAVGSIFGGGDGGTGRTVVQGLPWLDSSGGGGLLGLGGSILGGNSGSFWNSPITGHILGAVGSELLRENPYDVAYETALGRERGRRDALDFGFTPPARGNGLAPGMAAPYNREGGIKPASADWWQETDEERRRKKQELMGNA